MNIITLGAKSGMDKIFPSGIVESTAKLLVASGAVGATAVKFSRSQRAVSIYEAFDWMMPGQFDTFSSIPLKNGLNNHRLKSVGFC